MSVSRRVPIMGEREREKGGKMGKNGREGRERGEKGRERGFG